jgi:Beta-propeller repeat
MVQQIGIAPPRFLLRSRCNLTFLGGSGHLQSDGSPEFNTGETAYAIALDPAGNVYVAGTAESADLPTVNALQTNLKGSSNAFVAKINASGSALVYSTYLAEPMKKVASVSRRTALATRM